MEMGNYLTKATEPDIQEPCGTHNRLLQRANEVQCGSEFAQSDLCNICLAILQDDSEFGTCSYHSTLHSLEKSVQNGCHLCSLVHHFLPKRPEHQLDERLSLSLRLDEETGSIDRRPCLWAGWRHRVVSFTLLPVEGLNSKLIRKQTFQEHHGNVKITSSLMLM
jgi:hypothetical protein